MITPAVDGIELFKIAGRSISGWIPSFKMGPVSPLRQPFCSQLEERLLMWLEYHPQVVSYARGEIGPAFASAYRLPLPKEAHLPSDTPLKGNLTITSLMLLGCSNQEGPSLPRQAWKMTSGVIATWQRP